MSCWICLWSFTVFCYKSMQWQKNSCRQQNTRQCRGKWSVSFIQQWPSIKILSSTQCSSNSANSDNCEQEKNFMGVRITIQSLILLYLNCLFFEELWARFFENFFYLKFIFIWLKTTVKRFQKTLRFHQHKYHWYTLKKGFFIELKKDLHLDTAKEPLVVFYNTSFVQKVLSKES